MVLPHINYFRQQIIENIQHYYGTVVKIGALNASWQSFGPILEVYNISWAQAKININIRHITVALNIWQSLLHWNWHIRNLTLYYLDANSNKPYNFLLSDIQKVQNNTIIRYLLHNFENFILHNSKISFTNLSGLQIYIDIPKLILVKHNTRHRAEGKVTFYTNLGEYSKVKILMDLYNTQDLLTSGQIYLQADAMNMNSWLSRWIKYNIGIKNNKFSLAAWLTITNNNIKNSYIFIKHGQVNYSTVDKQHTLTMKNLYIQLNRIVRGYTFYIPQLNLYTDGIAWPQGTFSALYHPTSIQHIGYYNDEPAELRLRATNLQLECMESILPTIAYFIPDVIMYWEKIKPKGHIDCIGLDIPLHNIEYLRFIGIWNDISWKAYKLFPGVNHFNGSISGSTMHAGLTFFLKNSIIFTKNMLIPTRIKINYASGYTTFFRTDQGWLLSGNNINIQSHILSMNGSFRYQYLVNQYSWLNILPDRHLYNYIHKWQYFPISFMNKYFLDYVIKTLIRNNIDTETIVYKKNLYTFRYKYNYKPVKNISLLSDTKICYYPYWLLLGNPKTELLYFDDWLWISGINLNMLKKIPDKKITKLTPNYQKENFSIDANITGSYNMIYKLCKYWLFTNTIRNVLDNLECHGDINTSLHIKIPSDKTKIQIKGDIFFKNNSLLIKPLNNHFTQLNGLLHFENTNFTSNLMRANWCGQPVNFTITTTTIKDEMNINVLLKAYWHLSKLSFIPIEFTKYINGYAPLYTKIFFKLPYHGHFLYNIQLNSDLKNVKSQLPIPLNNKIKKEQLPLIINVKGTLNSLRFSGKLGHSNYFNSELIIQKYNIKLVRAIWNYNTLNIPDLPPSKLLRLSLPALNSEEWLTVLIPTLGNIFKDTKYTFNYPQTLNISIPQLILGGQIWHQLIVSSSKKENGVHVIVKGHEINGSAVFDQHNTFKANLAYLDYHPEWNKISLNKNYLISMFTKLESSSFIKYPKIIFSCKNCLIMGQHINQVDFNFIMKKNYLELNHGFINTGNTKLMFTGLWNKIKGKNYTFLKGNLEGDNITRSSNYFGFRLLPKYSSFNIYFKLNWIGQPWRPQINSLNGTLSSTLGKGEIDHAGGGRTGQILRLVSFDALLRKIKLDFSDIFGQGFYYDSIHGNGKFSNGILVIDDLLVDGLSADIVMNGSVNLVTHYINMKAIVAPDLSTTVGVATAFIINPTAGAILFAASKIFSSFWNKISLTCYNIRGDLNHPFINKIYVKNNISNSS
ncbi:AsmA2 domain-containing protein [Candidatus Profftia lariciata]|nr:AsmA2 domain-containing protein [Candidatus Profftia lariciata]